MTGEREIENVVVLSVSKQNCLHMSLDNRCSFVQVTIPDLWSRLVFDKLYIAEFSSQRKRRGKTPVLSTRHV